MTSILEFDEASRDLALLMAPVSADTLRATDPQMGRDFFGRHSEAEIWSIKMWGYTGLALLAIGLTELLQELSLNWYPLDPGIDGGWVYRLHLILVGLNILLPFVYGLLGACLYLLRKCHGFLHARTFDTARIAEYKNRMLLGFASGGIVMFFVNQVGVGDGDEVIQLSAPVLAIIAGYNSDFIFQAIERMAAAILPKVGIASARRAAPPPPKVRSVSIEALTEALAKANNEEDKKTIRAAIEAATKRL